MEGTLFVALIALVPTLMLLLGSVALINKTSLSSCLQLIGATGLLVVVLTHICEALELLPGMEWGAPRSAGHYLDLGCALAGVTLFPLGYLLHAFQVRAASQRTVP